MHWVTVGDNQIGPEEYPNGRSGGVQSLSKRWHRALKAALAGHGVPVCGEFCSAGYDPYAIFGVIGGIHRGRPDQRDVDRAVAFAKSLS